MVAWIVGRRINTFVTVDMHNIECSLRMKKPQLLVASDLAATVYVTNISVGRKVALLRRLTTLGWSYQQQNNHDDLHEVRQQPLQRMGPVHGLP